MLQTRRHTGETALTRSGRSSRASDGIVTFKALLIAGRPAVSGKGTQADPAVIKVNDHPVGASQGLPAPQLHVLKIGFPHMHLGARASLFQGVDGREDGAGQLVAAAQQPVGESQELASSVASKRGEQ
jgi:hypothetical protein